MSDEKKKILDVRIPKDEQEKLLKQKKYQDIFRSKKFRVDIEFPDGKVRFMYGDDPVVLETYAKAQGAKILKVTKL